MIKAFENKTVLITGGASGIGLGMARAFGEKGANLALLDIDESHLAEVADILEKERANVLCVPVDITEREQVIAAVDRVAGHFGGIHVVCANAGVSGRMESLDKVSVQDWDWVIDVNLKGSVYTIQACIPYLLKSAPDAHIVITSSISGLRVYRPSRGQGMYNTTKFALVGLGEALKADLEERQVGVSILCPGVVNTEISHSGRNRPEKYGGAFDFNSEHELAKAAGQGTDPLQFGRWVIRAIEQDKLIVITHPDDRELVEQRHQIISEAFAGSEEITGH